MRRTRRATGRRICGESKPRRFSCGLGAVGRRGRPVRTYRDAVARSLSSAPPVTAAGPRISGRGPLEGRAMRATRSAVPWLPALLAVLALPALIVAAHTGDPPPDVA